MQTSMSPRLLLGLTLLLAASLPGYSAEAPGPAAPGQLVMAQGAKLWVESEGQGEPLLLIAGGPGMSHDYFHPYFTPLAKTHRLVFFDAFGRGKSERAAHPAEYTFSRDVEDVEALRKALGLAKIDILAHSYGTLVAQAYALKYPQAVSHLVLISPLHSGAMWQESTDLCNREVQTTMPDVWKAIQALRSQGVKSSASAHQQAYRTPPGLYFYRENQAYRSLPLGAELDVYYNIVGDDADFVIGGEIAKLDFRPLWKQFSVPLLVLAGQHDRIALPDRAQEYKNAPNARVVMFEQSGHFPFIEETELAVAEISKFLTPVRPR